MIKVKIKNLGKVRKAFKKFPKRMAKNLSTAIKKSAFTIEANSKRETPVDHGWLRASIHSTIFPLSANVKPATNYACVVHEGRGGGCKKEKKYPKALSFKNAKKKKKGTGTGGRGNPYMTRGAKKSERKINQFFEKAVKKTIKNT